MEPASTSSASLGDTVRGLLHRRELAVARHRGAMARRLGVNDKEMLAIAYLAQRGELTPSELGSLLDLSSAGITAMVKRLEDSGHLDRLSHPTDGRSVLLRPSRTLVDRAEEAFRPLVAELQRLTEQLPPHDQAVVEGFLARVAIASEEHAENALRELSPRESGTPAVPLPGLWA